MNLWVVILKLGEESNLIHACDRAAGFFAKPQNDRWGKFVFPEPNQRIGVGSASQNDKNI
jgi:hypothetical protein